jgi:predicted secreted acid phosphatase
MSPARVHDPAVLDRIVDAARRVGERGAVVFDLDSTLLDNRPRQAQILREFGARVGVPHLAQVRPEHWTSWDIADAMRAAGATEQEIATHAEAAKDYWRSVFFTSAYCAIDEATPGAAGYVARLVTTGVQIVYCTGRHEEMRAGSIECFVRLGLPVPGHKVSLLMKPELATSDDAWKEQAYAELRVLGEVVAIFDNEPTHINGYRRAFPDAICVHLDTDHSGRPVTLLDGIVSVKRFADDARAVPRK